MNDKPKVGLLGLTLEFYERMGTEVCEGRERFVCERLIPILSSVADVRFEGAAFTRDEVERQVMAYEADGVEALLVVLLTYSPSLVSAPALVKTRLPIVVWNTQELWSVDTSYGLQELIDNHGVHGTHDLCNVLVRNNVPFGYATAHVGDSERVEELAGLLRAASGVSRLRRARLGLLGYPFPGMGDFGCDLTHMATTLGCAWEALSLSDYHRRAAEANKDTVKRFLAEYRKDYEIADDVTDDDLAATARAEIALRGLVHDHKLNAYSYQFLEFGEDERTETLPFVAASRLLAEGIGFGGEGDLISAAYSALVNNIAPPASFSEIFTIDFAGNAMLLSHMGEASVAMVDPATKVRLVKSARPLVPMQASQLVLVTQFKPGPATLSALTLTAGQRWRIIAGLVEIEPFGPCEGLQVPHTKVRPGHGDVRDFLSAYARAGGPHHLAICFGDARRELSAAAAFIGADYVEI